MNGPKNKRQFPVVISIVLMPVTIIFWCIGWLLYSCTSEAKDAHSRKKTILKIADKKLTP